MGSISAGIGLISGIDTASLIDQLILLESRGKLLIQQRVTNLRAQQTALLDVNSRLLNFRSAVDAFRTNSIFRQALATSSNDEIISATAAAGASPGSFKFIVQSLVATSQKLSRGYASRDAAPLGLTSLGFEFGRGTLGRDVPLETLNGGNGVARGRITITDRTGASATIDLTDVTTINEVIERINAASGIDVTAAVQGDALTISDNTAGIGTLQVQNAPGFTTATDLGLATTDGGAGDGDAAANGVIVGAAINTIGLNTSLSSLNDGNGVLILDGVADLRIQAKDQTQIDVDLGRLNSPITDSTLLADLNGGSGVAINDDEEAPDIQIVANNASLTYDIDLTGITTVGQLRNRIAAETNNVVSLEIVSGDRFRVVSSSGGGSFLRINGAGPNGTQTAEDLGILNEAGVLAPSYTGTVVENVAMSDRARTIGDVIDRINNATANLDAGLAQGRKVTASLAADGVSLLLTDNTGGGFNMRVRESASNAHAVHDLGIYALQIFSTPYRDGDRIVSALGSVMVSNLNGGTGLSGGATLSLTDRTGASVNVTGLNTFVSLSEVVDAINQQAATASVAITASLNAAGNGLLLTDTTGGGGSGNLIAQGDAAAALGLDTGATGVAQSSVIGANLQLRYVSEATALSELNYGRGVGTGGIRITDGLGASVTINIGTDAKTVYDVISEINAVASAGGVKINARINDQGDGLLIESAYDPGDSPFIPLKIEAAGGTVAADLNLAGESEDVDNAFIDGSYERIVDLDVTDTLDEVVKKIVDARIPVNATVLNTGSPAAPYRLSLTSDIAGARGELYIDTDGVDLGLTTLSRGADAKMFFGGDTPETGFLVTSASNTFTDIVPGLTLEAHRASGEAVTINVQRDVDGIVEAASQLAVTFNDVIGRIDALDFYDTETEERGVLLGDPTTSQVRSLLFSTITRPVEGVTTKYQRLSQVGFTVNGEGQIQFDEQKFRDAYENDRVAVENLFLALEAETESTEEIAPGVTVTTSTTTTTARGVVAIFGDLLDRLLDPVNGLVTRADEGFASRIEQFEDRIDVLDERLDAQRLRLQRDFAAMEAALAQLQGQSAALASLSLIVPSNSRLFGQSR